MKISAINNLLNTAYNGDDIELSGIKYDSRKVSLGDLFVCINGVNSDGHEYAKMAIEKGAKALLVERVLTDLSSDIPQLVVLDTRIALAKVAELYYGNPSDKLRIIGVTGTNGKTTTTHLIRNVLMAAGYKVGLIGTNHNIVGDEVLPSTHTTPESLEISELLAKMVAEGCTYAVIEVSSHGLSQHRVSALDFAHGVFTNLTQDHLDYHNGFAEYLAAKLMLFESLSVKDDKLCSGVVNIDDGFGEDFVNATKVKVITYGMSDKAMVQAKDTQLSIYNTKFDLEYEGNTYNVEVPYLGYFNVYNSIAAISVLIAEGLEMDFILSTIGKAEQVRGRFEKVPAAKDFAVIIDYAHSPDGLQNILKTANEIKSGRLILVFGCGGDRDKTKRPIMGKIGGLLADYSIITSDNPRTEDPLEIIQMVEDGMKSTRGEYEVIADRRLAIKKAISMAEPNDMVVIAGKGHEDYQIIGTIKHHFDDFEEANAAISERN